MSHVNRRMTAAPTSEDRRKWHKDWRTWVAVLLMLGAMAMYVMSLDDTIVPQFFGK